jgi:hypothetical protein
MDLQNMWTKLEKKPRPKLQRKRLARTSKENILGAMEARNDATDEDHTTDGTATAATAGDEEMKDPNAVATSNMMISNQSYCSRVKNYLTRSVTSVIVSWMYIGKSSGHYERHCCGWWWEPRKICSRTVQKGGSLVIIRVMKLQLLHGSADNINNDLDADHEKENRRLLLLHHSWNCIGHQCLPRISPWPVLCDDTILPKNRVESLFALSSPTTFTNIVFHDGNGGQPSCLFAVPVVTTRTVAHLFATQQGWRLQTTASTTAAAAAAIAKRAVTDNLYLRYHGWLVSCQKYSGLNIHGRC